MTTWIQRQSRVSPFPNMVILRVLLVHLSPVSPPTDEVAATKEEEGLSAEEIKYWSAVKENPSDFTSWTMLLQLIDHKVQSIPSLTPPPPPPSPSSPIHIAIHIPPTTLSLASLPQGKVDPAREVFNAFLQLYPYCYGYWKKYADFEKKHSGPDAAIEVSRSQSSSLPYAIAAVVIDCPPLYNVGV